MVGVFRGGAERAIKVISVPTPESAANEVAAVLLDLTMPRMDGQKTFEELRRINPDIPVLLMSVLWKGCTTRGAVIGGFLGLISSVALTVVSPSRVLMVRVRTMPLVRTPSLVVATALQPPSMASSDRKSTRLNSSHT